MEKTNNNNLFENKEDEKNFVSYVLSDLISSDKNIVEISQFDNGDFIRVQSISDGFKAYSRNKKLENLT